MSGGHLSGERRGVDCVDCKSCSTSPVIVALDCSVSLDIRTVSISNANPVFQWLCIQRNVMEGIQGRSHLQQQFLHKTNKSQAHKEIRNSKIQAALHEVFFWQRVSLCKTSLHSCTLQQQPGRAQALALEVRIQKAPGKGGRKSLQIDICLVVAA